MWTVTGAETPDDPRAALAKHLTPSDAAGTARCAANTFAEMRRPAWANNHGAFVNWLKNLQRDRRVLTDAYTDAIISEYKRLGIYVRLDRPNPGTKWNVPHLNNGGSTNVNLQVSQRTRIAGSRKDPRPGPDNAEANEAVNIERPPLF